MGGGFSRLSGALQYQIVNGLGWPGLRPVQSLTIDAVMDGDDCVVLAPTAGGKTEAAFFPLLSRMNDEDWAPTSVLYLSPIRALLNNQEERVAKLAGFVGRRAFKWHGDVSDKPRRRFIEDPADVLLTTPESLEAMLMSPRVPAREVFGGLRAVVIDEVHAFAGDDRGAHLAAVLERLSRYAGRELLRVGLSATVGNPEEILAWLRGGSARSGRVVDPRRAAGVAKKSAEIAVDFVGSMENAAKVIAALHRGRKRLVFVDSRRGVEELGAQLLGLGVATFVTHGSLAAHVRQDAERAFSEGQDCVIVATSALELGIDVGDLDHVIQIDAPGTVASFLQRMGRTGRRDGTTPNCTFLATSDDKLLQALAIVRLYEQGFVESVRPSRRAFHILAHQIMSLGIQMQGVDRAQWWAWLEGATPFEGMSAAERESVVAFMFERGILADHEGRVWLGEEGEKVFGRANFRALYAVFEAPRMIEVRHASSEVGTVDANFLAALQEDGDLGAFVLAGRTWQVLDIDWERGRCSVRPAEVGRAARWMGMARHLSYEVCQAMRELLADDVEDVRWTVRAKKVLAGLRAENYFLADGEEWEDVAGKDEVTWHNYAGGAANLLLARLLERELGGAVTSRNTSLTFKDEAGKSVQRVKAALGKLKDEGRPSRRDAMRFAPDMTGSRLSKFLPCLPDELARELHVEKLVDLGTARRMVGLEPEVGGGEGEGGGRAEALGPVVWVRNAEALRRVVAELMAEPVVGLAVQTALDDGRLCLVQLGVAATTYLVDVLAIADLGELGRLLAGPVVKVVHHAEGVRTALLGVGLRVDNVFDTWAESRRRHGKMGGGHSLEAVVRRELDRTLGVTGERWKTADWAARPLPVEWERVAAVRVAVLVELYGSMRRPGPEVAG